MDKEMLNHLVEQVSNGLNWAAGQIPEVVNQLLLYTLVKDLIFIFVCVGVIGLGVWLLKKCFASAARGKENNTYGIEYDPTLEVISGSVVVGTMVLCGATLLGRVLEIAQISIAPKVWVLEYLAHLVK